MNTYTYVTLEVSSQTFEEIFKKLQESGYQHAFHHDDGSVLIDMHGIALKTEKKVEGPKR